jgi:hypothetical protein
MSSFEVSRGTSIDADPARVHALVDDFHEWQKWSPWEEVDPNLERTYTGAEKGVGAKYSWKGNRKAGQGSMEITESAPERIDIALTFLKPFKGDNDVSFAMVPAGGGTEVTWTMSGEQKGLAALFGRFVSMDKLVGKDFEKGLAQLKTAAEA